MITIDTQAQTILIPVTVRRQLIDLSDQLWTKISVEFYSASAGSAFKVSVE